MSEASVTRPAQSWLRRRFSKDIAVTGNELKYAKIEKMSERELLDYIMRHPDYMTEFYYRDFEDAIYKRHRALVAAR